MRLMGFSLLSAATLVAGIAGFQTMDSKADDAQADSGITAMDHVVVAELFTSQGCSSCPPADAVAAELAENPDIIVVSRPVTYWDRLGWKDTLAKESNTDLQRNYAARGFAKAGVYTPQMVINGRAAAIGSRGYKVRELIMAEQKRGVPADLAISQSNGGDFIIAVSGKSQGSANVMLLALDSSETVSIGRGENGGRKLTYTNVLMSEDLLGRWDGNDKRFTVPASDLNVPGADRYAVIVRQGQSGPIMAASYIG